MFIVIIAAHIVLAAGINSALKTSLPTAFLVGLASHHLIDLLPHTDAACVWNREDQKKGIMPLAAKIFIIADFLAAFLFLLWFWRLGRQDFYLLFWSSVGAILPDVVSVAFPFWFPRWGELPFFKRYERLHAHTFFSRRPFDAVWTLGVASTILVLSFSVYLLL